MNAKSDREGYDNVYDLFNAPVMRQVREEAYGEDIGQHSWVTSEDLACDIALLRLSADSRLLDLGCGPCGPLSYIANKTGCRAMGLDASPEAIIEGKRRSDSLGLSTRVTLLQADLNAPLSLPDSSFEAVISLDVLLHLKDRQGLFREAARVLAPGGRFLFTDAAVITGPVSDVEVQKRATFGPVQLAPPGWNERLLVGAGFRMLQQQDRTATLLKTATGRLAARNRHRQDLEKLETSVGFDRQQAYLETVVSLSERGALSRIMYLADLSEA